MKYRKYYLTFTIAILLFSVIELFLSQLFSTTYYKDGELTGVMSSMYEGGKIFQFYVLLPLEIITLILYSIFAFLYYKNSGIFIKQVKSSQYTNILVIVSLIICQIIIMSSRSLGTTQTISWVLLGFLSINSFYQSKLVYKLYKVF